MQLKTILQKRRQGSNMWNPTTTESMRQSEQCKESRTISWQALPPWPKISPSNYGASFSSNARSPLIYSAPPELTPRSQHMRHLREPSITTAHHCALQAPKPWSTQTQRTEQLGHPIQQIHGIMAQPCNIIAAGGTGSQKPGPSEWPTPPGFSPPTAKCQASARMMKQQLQQQIC